MTAAKICKMNDKLPIKSLPDNIVNYIYRIVLWVEKEKNKKGGVVKWKNGIKHIKIIKVEKIPLKDFNKLPTQIPDNTIFVPKNYSGKDVLRHIRHAFCHGDLTYDFKASQIRINKSKKVKMVGCSSLEGLQEFVSIFLSDC